MLILVAFWSQRPQREANGTKVVPQTAKMDLESIKMEPNGHHRGGQDHPKDVSREGSAKRSKKRRARAGNNQANGFKIAPCLEPCGSFCRYFSIFV